MKNLGIFTILCVIMAAVSCQKTELVGQLEKGYGSLEMSMAIDGETKAFTEEDLYASAIVNIYKADYSGLVRSYSYNEMPSPFYLAVGDYRVDVQAGECTASEPASASWENKSYKGTETFSIVENQTQTIQVTAYVNNAVTNITLDPTVAENFVEGYSFTIGLDTEDASTQLVYDATKSGSDGYYIVAGLFEPSFKWTFTGTLVKDRSTFTKSGVIENVEAGNRYQMNVRYTIKDGDLDFTLLVDKTTTDIDDTIVFEPVSTGLSASSVFETWATRTTLHADVDAGENAGKTIQFSYSADGATWTTVDGVQDSEGTYKADISGLTPATTYSYKLLIAGEDIGDPLTFTTESAPNLPNASFEYVSKVTGESYYKFYDPNCGVDEGSYMFWGSGNGEGSEGVEGSASMGITITDIDTADKIDGNQSVIAQTSSMVGKLAAGNLFTGQFAGLVNTDGGKVNFGRPWTSRPSALKVWCKYSTGKFNIVNNNNLGVSTSDYDRAQIKVALGTWDYKKYGGTKDSPVHVNTTDPSTFVDYYTDPSTIANGDVIIYNDGYSINKGEKVTATTTGWIEYIIPLEYHNLNAYPTHIVVSCAASQYGDYFTGYDKTKLWIDAVELIY